MTATSSIGRAWAETDSYVLDGNAIAGVLEELFNAEMTTARRVCQSCGRRNAIGAHALTSARASSCAARTVATWRW